MARRPNYRFQSMPKPQFELNTNKHLDKCEDRDVVSFNSEKWIGVKKLKQIIAQSFSQAGISSVSEHISSISEFKGSQSWFFQGEKCEILRAGSKGWQKGKIKINVTLEFIPDEPEETTSPLDDIRQAETNNIV